MRRKIGFYSLLENNAGGAFGSRLVQAIRCQGIDCKVCWLSLKPAWCNSDITGHVGSFNFGEDFTEEVFDLLVEVVGITSSSLGSVAARISCQSFW
jgi:hypothetical protein